MGLKVKHFEGYPHQLSEKMNAWLKKNKVEYVDLKLTDTSPEVASKVHALLIYKLPFVSR